MYFSKPLDHLCVLPFVLLYCKPYGINSSALGQAEILYIFLFLHFQIGYFLIRGLGHTWKKTAFDLREQSNPCMSKEGGHCLEKRQLLPKYLKSSVYMLNLYGATDNSKRELSFLQPVSILSHLLGTDVASLPYPTL